MSVILTPPEDIETWMTAPWFETKHLQRAAPDYALMIVEKPATQINYPAAQQSPAQGDLL